MEKIGSYYQSSIYEKTAQAAKDADRAKAGSARKAGGTEEGKKAPTLSKAAQNLLNRVLVGRTARDARRQLDENAIEALSDPLVQLIIDEVVDCLGDADASRAHSLGISSLLRQPEFSDAKALLPVMEVLEDDRVLFHAFDDAVGEDGPIMVRIGHENPTSELAGVSIVACPYGRGRSEGVVAVIGPTRMNYQNAIRAVRAAQCVLHDE